MNQRIPRRDVISRTPGPSILAAGDGLEGTYLATLHTAPSGGLVKVVIPDLSLTSYYTANISPGFTGSAGDVVMVAFDSDKTAWVLSPTGVSRNATEINGVTVPLTGSAWIAPTLINSWANYGSSYATAGYLKDPFGFVHIRGAIKSGTVAAPAFILPAGYRPAAYQQYLTVTGGVNGPYPTNEGGVVIYPTGEVYVYGSNASGFTDLAGIAPFLAEN